MAGYVKTMFRPGLRRVLAASVPADLADWLDFIAIIVVLVYQWDSGPWALALVTVFLGLPYVVIGPLAGVLTDRASLRAVLVASNVGRALCTLGFIFAPNLPVLLILVLLRSSIDSAFTPARQSAVQRLVPDEDLETANGLVFGINQATKIVGPGLGGLLLVFLSAQAIFAFNAVMSLVAALILAGLALPPRAESGEPKESIFHGVISGFRALLASRTLVIALALFAAGFFSIFLYDSLFGLLAREFGLTAAFFGFANAMVGVGGVAGALTAGALKLAAGPMRVMALGALVSGPVTVFLGGAALLGWNFHESTFLVLAALLGAAVSFIVVPYRAVVQRETPPDKIARVVATGEAVSTATMLSAPFLGALLADRFGTGTPFAVGGVILLLVGLAAFAHRASPQPLSTH